jgi:hypothetical protein
MTKYICEISASSWFYYKEICYDTRSHEPKIQLWHICSLQTHVLSLTQGFPRTQCRKIAFRFFTLDFSSCERDKHHHSTYNRVTVMSRILLSAVRESVYWGQRKKSRGSTRSNPSHTFTLPHQRRFPHSPPLADPFCLEEYWCRKRGHSRATKAIGKNSIDGGNGRVKDFLRS